MSDDLPYTPTPAELDSAHSLFEKQEPRALFYRSAIELIRLANAGVTEITSTEALAGLLQTWNVAYYRYRPKLLGTLPQDLAKLQTRHERELELFRVRSIEDFEREDRKMVLKVFNSFDRVLGPVGTAKALHLLAPEFFPLWDAKIARAYGLGQPKPGRNGQRYVRFMELMQGQCQRVGGERAIGRNPIKALDEFNYCRYTRGWI